MEIWKEFEDMLFPEKGICFFCGEYSDEISQYICHQCENRIEYLNNDIPFEFSYIDRISYSLFYSNFIREHIFLYKYHGRGYLYKPFGEILINTFLERFSPEDIDIITNVPIHRRKKAMRGFDQSELLAGYISQRMNIYNSRKNLLRVKETKSQNKLNKEQRRTNIEGAFQVRKKEEFGGKRILILDDIITTGITFEESAKVLKDCGAEKVYGLALTSGMKF